MHGTVCRISAARRKFDGRWETRDAIIGDAAFRSTPLTLLGFAVLVY